MDPQERLLGGLGHALRVWPGLEPALRDAAPTGVDLSLDDAFGFLREAAPALEQAGFAVLAPAWWQQRLRPKLRVSAEQEPQEASGLLDISGLCAYEWQLAVGDATLTLAELRELAAHKLPLVKSRGRWVALRPEDVEAALAFFERREERGEATAGELLREGLGLDAAAAGLADVEIDADGWLRTLFSTERDRRIEPLSAPAAFVGELRPYQERGLSWMFFLSRLGIGACLADDMGLGKTVQLLALLLTERERRERPRKRVAPTLLVCPMSVVGNWEREAGRFAPGLRVHVHHGRERLTGREFARAARASDLVVTTYALATRDHETLAAVKWERIALDEAQNIKNAGAKQTRTIRTLPARHRIALTGTPVENRLSELHSIMDFLNPGLLGTAAGFRERFATPIERYRDDAATARLKQATAPFILRRLKTDREIITDLPEKIEMKVDCHLTREQATLYQAVVDEMLEKAEQAEGIERRGIVLAALTKLKQVCNHPAHLLRDRSRLHGRSGKLARVEEILAEALAEGDKALCFTQFAEFGHMLGAHLQERLGHEVLFLHGGTLEAGAGRDGRALPGARRAGAVRAVAQGRRDGSEPDGGQPRDPLRPLVEPGGRRSGDRPGVQDRPAQERAGAQAHLRRHAGGAHRPDDLRQEGARAAHRRHRRDVADGARHGPVARARRAVRRRRRGGLMAGWSYHPDYEPTRPLPAAGGIAARSRRGAIGETWWSRRFIALLESFGVGSRLTRGRNYARRGQVAELEVEPGIVLARGTGLALHALPRPDPHQGPHRTSMAACGEGDGGAGATAREAAGGRDAARDRGPSRGLQAHALPLVPARAEGQLHLPRRSQSLQAHRRRLLHPRRALRRGSVRDLRLARPHQGGAARTLAGPARQARRDRRSPRPTLADDSAPLSALVDRFWSAGPELAELRVSPLAAAAPDALLRRLGPGPVQSDGQDVAELLAPAYARLAQAAERRGLA